MPPQQPQGFDPSKPFTIFDPAKPFTVVTEDKPIDPTQGRSAASRAVGGVLTGSGLNPVPVVERIVSEASKPSAEQITLPMRQALETIAPLAHIPGAWKALTEGRFTDAANEFARSIPVIGPAAQHASERMKSGDVAGGAGEVVGLAASAASAARRPTLTASIGERVGTMAERGSERRMTNAIAPQVGANKVRFGNQAAEVAPRLAREEGMGAGSRANLADKVSARLQEAESSLDAASDARDNTKTYSVSPIIKALSEERDKLTAEGVKGSVVPAPNAARAGIITQAIREISSLGSEVRYDPIRTIRAAYDQIAKQKYAPSVTQDYLTKAGEASGAADVTRVLREHLGGFDPDTALANKEYSYWRKVNDVLQAAEETERVRPSRGRGMITRGIGAATGGAAGGGIGAIAGLIVAEGAERIVQSGATTKFIASRYMAKIADALKTGNNAAAKSNLQLFAKLTGTGTRLSDLYAQQQKEPE